jgi:hypothetical protein
MRGVVQVTPWAAGMFLVPARPPLRPGCPRAEISEGPLGGLSVLAGRRTSYGLAFEERGRCGCVPRRHSARAGGLAAALGDAGFWHARAPRLPSVASLGVSMLPAAGRRVPQLGDGSLSGSRDRALDVPATGHRP